jgi:hypothetical protein
MTAGLLLASESSARGEFLAWITSQVFDMEQGLAIANGLDYAWAFGDTAAATSGHFIHRNGNCF